MGNSHQNKNDEKLISTVWLGVNNDWKSLMKDRLSHLDEEWVIDVIKCLSKYSSKEQMNFRSEIKSVCQLTTQVSNFSNEDQMKEIQQQSQEFLISNEFLRDDTCSRTCSFDLTLSTSYNSFSRIDEAQSMFSLKQDQVNTETQVAQTQQFYFVFTLINKMINSKKHPFLYMINQFQQWTKTYINNLFSSKLNQFQIQTQIVKFGATANQFINFLIHALNEYLGEIYDDQIGDLFQNKYLQDKANYFNYFLSITINETITIQLIEILKMIHKNNIQNLSVKIAHILKKPDFFEIPQKYMNQAIPFQQQIEQLLKIQVSRNPAEKYYVLSKGYQQLRQYLTKGSSNFLQLQAISYVLVHTQICNFHVQVHLLELFYPSSPLLLKYNSSLQFLQSKII